MVHSVAGELWLLRILIKHCFFVSNEELQLYIQRIHVGWPIIYGIETDFVFSEVSMARPDLEIRLLEVATETPGVFRYIDLRTSYL